MAANATIHKAILNIANMDQHYYEEHSLTLAQHPSENKGVIRLFFFAFPIVFSQTKSRRHLVGLAT